MEVSVMSDTIGFEGEPGNVEGSGVRWKITRGLVGDSTVREADQLVSPVSDVALHVYNPVSDWRRSENKHMH